MGIFSSEDLDLSKLTKFSLHFSHFLCDLLCIYEISAEIKGFGKEI